MEKKEWKKGEKIDEKGVWMRGGGGEKSGGAQPFSLWAHPNSISPKWGENRGEKEEECAGQNCPSPSHGQLFVFFSTFVFPLFFCFVFCFGFFFWIKFCTVDVGSFCLFLFFIF